MAQYSIAGYTINLRDRLGKGGYGTVYKARDNTGTIVAVPTSRNNWIIKILQKYWTFIKMTNRSGCS